MSELRAPPTRVLLAEDDATTRALLSHLLRQWGYDVEALDNGARANERLEQPEAPRLAVLDWHMPGLGGVEVCRRLQARKASDYVYVILITSSNEAAHFAEALDSGASDFLTKPIVPSQLQSRLGVARRVLDYHDQLAHKNSMLRKYAMELEALAASRAKQLLHADRMATLGLLTAGIAHEVNNPATFISGNVQTLRDFWPEVEVVAKRALPSLDAAARAKLEFVLEEVPRALTSMQGGVKRISSIVKGLKAYSRQGAREKQACDLNQCVQNALGICAHEVQKRGAAVSVALGPGLPPVFADGQQLEQVIINLAVNAAQAMQNVDQRRLCICTAADERDVRVIVEDTGPGIPSDLMDRIWQPFFTTKAAGEGTGLGLSICRDIVKEHEGELTVENRTEGGARFTLVLPRAQQSEAA